MSRGPGAIEREIVRQIEGAIERARSQPVHLSSLSLAFAVFQPRPITSTNWTPS